MSQTKTGEGVKNVVLVHGGVRGRLRLASVYDLLRKDGYNVSIRTESDHFARRGIAVARETSCNAKE
jgi:hypothetical protein